MQLYFITNTIVCNLLQLYFVSRKLRETSTVLMSPTILCLKIPAVLRQAKFFILRRIWKRKQPPILKEKNNNH